MPHSPIMPNIRLILNGIIRRVYLFLRCSDVFPYEKFKKSWHINVKYNIVGVFRMFICYIFYTNPTCLDLVLARGAGSNKNIYDPKDELGFRGDASSRPLERKKRKKLNKLKKVIR